MSNMKITTEQYKTPVLLQLAAQVVLAILVVGYSLVGSLAQNLTIQGAVLNV